MAILFMEGFDWYTNDSPGDFAGRLSTTGTTTRFNRSTATRNGHGAALAVEGGTTTNATFPNIATVYFGIAVKFNSIPAGASTFLRFYDGGSIQLNINLNTDGTLYVVRSPSTNLGVGTFQAVGNTWFHLAGKIVIDNTVGSVELRINGSATPDINLSGIDTQATSNAYTNQMMLLGNNATFAFDDWVIADDTGAQAFLGDYDIYTIFPDGAGASAQFTPLSGSNWQNVDENPHDGDTSYNESQTVGHKDRFTMGNVPTDTDTIYAVQVGAFAKKTDVASRELNVLAYDGTTEGAGSDTALSTSYAWVMGLFEDHPSGAAAWTESEVNSMEAGYEVAV